MPGPSRARRANSLLRLSRPVLTCACGDALARAPISWHRGRVSLRPGAAASNNKPRPHRKSIYRGVSMASDTQVPGLVKTYFWMVHYDFSPVAETTSADGLTPIPAGKRKGVVVINRNLSGSHVINFNMPREREGTPDPSTFRGASVLRNRIIGFYASAEEANAHLNSKLWKELQ